MDSITANGHRPSHASTPPEQRANRGGHIKKGAEASDDDDGGNHSDGGARPTSASGLRAAAAARGRPDLLRTRSDFGPRDASRHSEAGENQSSPPKEVAEWGIKHGFDQQLASEEQMYSLNQNYFMYFTDKKHETGGIPREDHRREFELQEWRMRDRLKTVSAVLALCLNLGVDPPDVVKTNPCAKLECWVDPSSSSGQNTNSPINQIGKALQTQYEQLSMRTRYKLCLDPTVEETRRYSQTLRRNARNERVLFHYNGHGVPKPTPSGEIWVFNRNYTQYIPISLYDLQAWIGAPSLFVWDCADAGSVIKNFMICAKKHEQEASEVRHRDPQAEVFDFSDCIHLASCREKETLPTNPDLPADVFTCCLTTPIEMAVRFFILQNPLPSGITLDDANNIPGRVSERRTPIGELNWIFTAITDTIAWNSLPKPLFKRLFRQDLMVAALFRNFLLAQRIMRVYHCHPQSHPDIPDTHNHPLWQSWDLAVEMILAQLPDLLAAERGEKQYEYQHSNFFAEQLTAFDVYLGQGAVEKKVPEQLPIVLQVLLSQVHRLRALVLLSKFLDLGPWAVNLALSIGIFPYVLKLLQSQAVELKPVMIFIWARILAVDQTCQTDLLKDNGYQYFIGILDPRAGMPVIANLAEHRAMCAFIIAMFCKDFRQGQNVCLLPELFESLMTHLVDMTNPLLRQWSCLCLSMLWVNYPEAKWMGIRCNTYQRLCELVIDPIAEVRTAMLHALTNFLGIPDITPQVIQIEESIASNVLVIASDGNSMVRKELLIFFSTFIPRYENRFIVAAYEHMVEEKNELLDLSDSADRHSGSPLAGQRLPSGEDRGASHNTVYSALWTQVLSLTADPQPEVAQMALTIVLNVLNAALRSPLAAKMQPMMDVVEQVTRGKSLAKPSQQQLLGKDSPAVQSSVPRTPPTPSRQPESYLQMGIKRTASVAQSLKNFAFGTLNPDTSPPSSMKQPQRATHNGAVGAPRSRIPSEWQRPPGEHDQLSAASSAGAYHAHKIPAPNRFRPAAYIDIPSLPLKSVFFEWSVEYFREPQMKATEAEEPGSLDYNERLWRRNRNDKIIAKTQPLQHMAGSTPWNQARGLFNNGTQPLKMCFHQFEEHLVVSDDRDTVSVWDWKRQARLNRFSNGNPRGSRITEIRLINEDDQARLMTGSSDGIIRIFRDYEHARGIELVEAFRALTDLVPSNRNAGLVFDWQQGRGNILVAGDVRVIRIWNAGSEICGADIPARSGSCITSLTSDQVEGNLFVAGFGDGAVRVYDVREKPQTAMVRVWKEHRQWVTNVHLQRGGTRELVTGCRSGEVKLWDLRMQSSLRTVRATRDTLRTLSVHEHAPVFATGTSRHRVKVWSAAKAEGIEQLSSFEPYTGFLHQSRSSPVAATCFHPHRMMIAAAATNDTHVNIFACPNTAKKTDELGWEKGDGGHA